MTEPAVAAAGLTKRFKGTVAVRGLTLSVRQGEVFGLLGPNGAGKTTTIQMLVGLQPPTEGTITVAGVNVVRDPSALTQKIGYMSEGFTLYGGLTVDENLSSSPTSTRSQPRSGRRGKRRCCSSAVSPVPPAARPGTFRAVCRKNWRSHAR